MVRRVCICVCTHTLTAGLFVQDCQVHLSPDYILIIMPVIIITVRAADI